MAVAAGTESIFSGLRFFSNAPFFDYAFIVKLMEFWRKVGQRGSQSKK